MIRTAPRCATQSLGYHDPTEVVLMEIEPERQKTRGDFAMTEQVWGVRAIDTGDVIERGGDFSIAATAA